PCSRSGKSPHSAAEPRPSCSMTMVGASEGAGPIIRYSSSAVPMRRKPEGESVVISPSALAARCGELPSGSLDRSLPLVGEGTGGGKPKALEFVIPPSPPLPHKGGESRAWFVVNPR